MILKHHRLKLLKCDHDPEVVIEAEFILLNLIDILIRVDMNAEFPDQYAQEQQNKFLNTNLC